MKTLRAVVYLGALLAVQRIAPAGAQGIALLKPVGAAAVVRGRVEAVAQSSGLVGRVIGSGQPIYLNDLITTDNNGHLQIVLLDETVFTLGPNASLLIDRFIYDPDSGSGEVSARIVKGVFRFITGKIAQKKPSSMKVALPFGTIGIFGTMVAGKVDDQESTVVLMGPGGQNNADEKEGRIRVENAGKSVMILRPGYATKVSAGHAPSPPFLAPKDLLDQLSQSWGLSRRLGENMMNSAGRLKATGSPQAESGQSAAFGRELVKDQKDFTHTNGQAQDIWQSTAKDVLLASAFTSDATSSMGGLQGLRVSDFNFPIAGSTVQIPAGCTTAICQNNFNYSGFVTVSFANKLISPSISYSTIYSFGPVTSFANGSKQSPAVFANSGLAFGYNMGWIIRFLNGARGPASQIQFTPVWTNAGTGLGALTGPTVVSGPRP